MKIEFAITFIAFIAISSTWADVRIGDRSFPLHFEDDSLTIAERAAIEADVTAFWESRTNAVFEAGTEGSVRGRIFDDAVYSSPYASGQIDVPSWIVLHGTNLNLRIPSEFSTEFRTRLAVWSVHTNQTEQLFSFLECLRPERLAVASDAEVSSLVFRNSGTPTLGATEAAKYRRDLGAFVFSRPSVLGIAETNGISESPGMGLVAFVPASSRGSNPQDYVIFRVGWDGTKWLILSLF